MVGLPGLGKSTAVERTLDILGDNSENVFVYSTDAVIERIANQLGKSYDEVFSDHIKSAQAEADIDLAYNIDEKMTIIWDQTNTTVKKRKRIIDKMKRSGYDVECVYIRAPEAGQIDDMKEWKRRLDSRDGKKIPDDVITNMQNGLVEPTVEEGFDRVVTYNMYGEKLSEQNITE
jgi:tRNA uridine 5-carbamoylmethylation protein Kti12